MQSYLSNSADIQSACPVAGAGAWGHEVEVGGTEACKIQEFVKASEPKQTRIPKTQLAGAGEG